MIPILSQLILELIARRLFRQKIRVLDHFILILLFNALGIDANSLRGVSSGDLKREEYFVETGGNDPIGQLNDIPVAAATFPIHAKQGTHHVHIYIGSPPQRQTLIVDTGSRLMAFPCEPCDTCGKHVTPSYFDPSRSSTAIENSCGMCKFEFSNCYAGRCEFDQRYMEGSAFKAFEMEDIIWIGSDDMDDSIEQHMQFSVPYSFGCLLSEKGLFKTQYADGIIGLAKSDISFIEELYRSGAIMNYGFSICMTRFNGYFSIGGTPYSYPKMHHLEPMTFVPSVNDNSLNNAFYRIKIEKVKLGNITITNVNSLAAFTRHKGTIIDSGTSDTYLPLALAEKFQITWTWLTGFKHSNSMKSFTYEEFTALPNLVILLKGGYEWIIEPNAYMEESRGLHNPKWRVDTLDPWEGNLVFSNRIYINERKGCVLGANAMLGHDIFFEKNRIGIARANCNMS